MLTIYASGSLTVCAMWVAFSRRRMLQYFVIALAVNGLLVAILGVAQRITKASKIYWSVESPNASFFGTFIYKNHGGAYLDLILAITCGLASWFYLRGQRTIEKSNPSGVLAFFATFIAIAVLVSYARGATVPMLALLLGIIGAFLVHQMRLPKESRRSIIAFALLLVFGVFLKTGLEALKSGEAWDRLRQGMMREDLSLEMRERATTASLEMLGENWPTGVGAGSFRFVFPIYQHRHPEITADAGGQVFWEHALMRSSRSRLNLGLLGVGYWLLVIGFWFLVFASRYTRWLKRVLGEPSQFVPRLRRGAAARLRVVGLSVSMSRRADHVVRAVACRGDMGATPRIRRTDVVPQIAVIGRDGVTLVSG